MLAECLGIVGKILLVGSEIAVGCNCNSSVNGRTSTECALKVTAAVGYVRNTEVCSKVKTVDGSQNGCPLTCEHILVYLVLVVFVVTNSITHNRRTLLVGLVGVIYNATVVGLDCSVGITYIKRIDRSHHITDVEHVARASP